MITLADLARQAGVSHSTVSRALADSPLVNPQTKRRIQELARAAGYQVNQVARNLKVRSTRTLGLVVPEVSNPYHPRVVQRVADRVRAAGYNLLLQLSGADQEDEARCLASLQAQRVDGVLLVTGERGLVARSAADTLVAAGAPVVLMGWCDGAEGFDRVTGDDAAGGAAIARHLIALGHRQIATLGKPPHRGPYDRLLGFGVALAEAGIDLPDERRLRAAAEAEVADAVRALLALPEPPTALFAYQDSFAALVLGHLADACVPVPQAMTVVGFDGLDLADYLCPRLTTVGGHIEPLADAMVRILVDRLQNPTPSREPQQVVVAPQLRVQGSCAPPRTGPLLQKVLTPCG